MNRRRFVRTVAVGAGAEMAPTSSFAKSLDTIDGAGEIFAK